MRKGLLFIVLLSSFLTGGCQQKDVTQDNIDVVKEVVTPSDNVELPSDRILQSVKVDEFAKVIVETSEKYDEFSVSYELDIDKKTLYVYEDVENIDYLVLMPQMFPDDKDFMSTYNSVVDSFVGTAREFQIYLNEIVDGWTLVMSFGDKETNTWYIVTEYGEVIYDINNK